MRWIKPIVLVQLMFIVCSCKTYLPIRSDGKEKVGDNLIPNLRTGIKYKFLLKDHKTLVMKFKALSGDSITGLRARVRYQDDLGNWHHWESWDKPIILGEIESIKQRRVNFGLSAIVITAIVLPLYFLYMDLFYCAC